MKKFTLPLLLIGLFCWNSPIACMKRKRSEDNENSSDQQPPSKKRKIQSYDQFLTEDGFFCCPTCKETYQNQIGFHFHLSRAKHGPFETGESPSRPTFQKIGGRYYCHKCDFAHPRLGEFLKHLKNEHKKAKKITSKKRKRNESEQSQDPPPAKKRTSKYDQYFKDGKYHCFKPGCNYSHEKLNFLAKHLARAKHGPYYKDGKMIRTSKYDQYFKDGKYHCFKPGCNYSHEKSNFLATHLARAKHGPYYKDGKVIRRPSKYDQYRQNDEKFHCPNCKYSTLNKRTFAAHLKIKRHGHFTEPEQNTPLITSQKPINFFFEQDNISCTITILPSFAQQKDNNSALYALFAATHLKPNDNNLCDNFAKFEKYVADWKKLWEDSEKDRDAIIQILNRTGHYNKNVFVIDTLENFTNKDLFANNEVPKIIILQITPGHWVAMKLTRKNNPDTIEIADSTYKGIESLNELVDIIIQLYEKLL